MAEKLSEDYASYFQDNKISKELIPLQITAEQIKTRTLEIENVFLQSIKTNTDQMHDNLNQVAQFKDKFDEFCDSIDDLERLVEEAKRNLDDIEKQMDIADEELDIPEKKLDIVLNTLNFFKPKNLYQTNLNSQGNYEPPKIFDTTDYFHSEPKP